jgi:hypothetical protein
MGVAMDMGMGELSRRANQWSSSPPSRTNSMCTHGIVRGCKSYFRKLNPRLPLQWEICDDDELLGQKGPRERGDGGGGGGSSGGGSDGDGDNEGLSVFTKPGQDYTGAIFFVQFLSAVYIFLFFSDMVQVGENNSIEHEHGHDHGHGH